MVQTKRRPRKITPRYCLMCSNRVFANAFRKYPKYCSRECRKKNAPPPANKGKIFKPHNCLICSQPTQINAYGNYPKYCSDDCRAKGRRPVWNKGKKGIAANRPRTGTEKPCAHCGQHFYAPLNKAEIKYCSHECYHLHRWDGTRKVIRNCATCTAEFQCRASDQKVTCGKKECRSKYLSQCRKGPKSHFWRGGTLSRYKEDWKEKRVPALERDGYKCALCGDARNISVHHVIPYRYSQSHDLNNLITLCRRCHSTEELKVNKASVAGLLARWDNAPEPE